MHNLGKKIPLLIATSILLFFVGIAVYIFGYLTPTYETPGSIVSQIPAENLNTPIESVIIATPQPSSVVSSPLTVQGQATGTWFFEAALPIQIVDGNEKVVGKGVASAQADWMTENLVPFAGSIKFSTPNTPTGWIIIKKNNPSGLPENDDGFRIPVRFE